MPKKSMGGRKNGQIGERKWEQISIFDDYLMGDVEGQDDEYFERKEPANVFRIDNKQDNQHRNRGLDESFRDSLSADQKISGSGVSRATGTFVHSEAVIVENETGHGSKEDDGMVDESATYQESTNLHLNRDFRLTVEHDEHLSLREKLNNNINAIKVLRNLQSSSNLSILPEQQEVLSKYSGWGGLPHIFNEDDMKYAAERNILKQMLTIKEYQNARASTLSSFYTPLVIVEKIYEILDQLGFKKGNILEPSLGTGNFIGMMPYDMLNESSIHGVELDTITGGIAQMLYPSAKVEISGFEEANVPDNFYDLAISNVPFGNYQVHDINLNSYGFAIHNYFFAKSLSKVREGGIICFITSTNTMDGSSRILEYINLRADFIGAVRLPTNIFNINGANTTTTTDVIILQKNSNKQPYNKIENWMQSEYFSSELKINKYFIDNPDMIFGTPKDEIGRFGQHVMRVNYDGISLDEHFARAMAVLPSNIYYEAVQETVADTIAIDNESFNLKLNTYFVKDDNVYIRDENYCILVHDNELNNLRRKELIKIAELAEETVSIQSSNKFNEKAYLALRNSLNIAYDSFIKKHNYINSRAIKNLLERDPRQYLILNLESKGVEANTYIKSDIFKIRTINPVVEIKHVESIQDAISASLNFKGMLDLNYMSIIYDKSIESIEKEMHTSAMVFYDPKEERWQLESEYLSGNILEKIDFIRENNLIDRYEKNINVLNNVMPEPLTITDITFQLGAPYIPTHIYEDFACYLFRFENMMYDSKSLTISFINETGQFAMDYYEYRFFGNSFIEDEWGVPLSENIDTDGVIKRQPRYNGFDLLNDVLNSRIPTLKNYWEEINEGGIVKTKSEINSERTGQARELSSQLENTFVEFVFDNEKYCREIEDEYNRLFNVIRPRIYNGEFLSFPEMNNSFQMEEYQKNAIARIIYGKNTLLSQQVGAGKTFEMIASGMEMKRMGKRNKLLYVVPNHLIGQWRNEFLTLYPQANILAISTNDFGTKKRADIVNKMAVNNYDAVIMGHSSFKLIPMDNEIQLNFLNEEIDKLVTAIEEAKANGSHQNTAVVKLLERSKKAVEKNVKKLTDIKRDQGITFDKLGVDYMFVDEAHEFKNLYTYTAMSNIAGVPQARSQKASDMYMKCKFIQKSGGNVCFATGTPITNTMAELFTMQRYLQEEELERLNIHNFDAWAKTFGKVVTSLEVSVDGSGFQTRQRFNKFFNIPELMNSFREVAEIQTESMLNNALENSKLQRKRAIPPKHVGDKAKVVSIEPSPELEDYIANVVERTEAIHNSAVAPYEDNMLKVTSDSKKASIDLRLIDESYGLTPDNKLTVISEQIYRIYDEYRDQKATQLVFCDSSTPKSQFNVYDEIKNNLIKLGVNDEEIAFIHDYKTTLKKEKLYRDVNKGEVRVLIGSTAKLGAGTNVQQRMIAIHHVDVPWRASDIAQRNGRVFRQGNMNNEVYEFRYATKKSFDAYSWQLIETKSTYMNQLLEGSGCAREIEEDTKATFSYAEIKAIASGNPLIKEKLEVDTRLKTLESSLARHRKAIRKAQDDKRNMPEKIKNLEMKFDRISKDYSVFKKHINFEYEMINEKMDIDFKVEYKDKVFTDLKEYGDFIIRLSDMNKEKNSIPIGKMMGFEFILDYNVGNGWNICFKGANNYLYNAGLLNAVGRVNVGRMIRKIFEIKKDYEKYFIQINNMKENYAKLDDIINKKFESQEELLSLRQRQKEITNLLTDNNNGVVLEENEAEEIELEI